MLNVKVLLGATAVALSPAVVSAATVLDDFSVLQRVEDAPSANPSSNSVDLPLGTRSMDIVGTPSPAATATSVVTLSSGARTEGVPQDLSFSNDTSFQSVANLVYDFSAPLDLSDGGGFMLGFKGTDNPFYLTLSATGGGGSASQEVRLTSADTGTLSFDFGGFGGVDFSSVESLSLTFDSVRTVTGVDADFDNFSVAAIPLPAAGLMLIAGLGGLGLMRQRKS